MLCEEASYPPSELQELQKLNNNHPTASMLIAKVAEGCSRVLPDEIPIQDEELDVLTEAILLVAETAATRRPVCRMALENIVECAQKVRMIALLPIDIEAGRKEGRVVVDGDGSFGESRKERRNLGEGFLC